MAGGSLVPVPLLPGRDRRPSAAARKGGRQTAKRGTADHHGGIGWRRRRMRLNASLFIPNRPGEDHSDHTITTR